VAILVVLGMSLFWESPLLLLLFLVILSTVMIAIGKIKEDVYLYIIVFFVGPAVEITAIAFGAWKYSFPNMLGIPIWLPFAWGSAGLFIKRIYLEISNLN
jgi:uncharacterized membrane protein YoaT (DUF817 family)